MSSDNGPPASGEKEDRIIKAAGDDDWKNAMDRGSKLLGYMNNAEVKEEKFSWGRSQTKMASFSSNYFVGHLQASNWVDDSDFYELWKKALGEESESGVPPSLEKLGKLAQWKEGYTAKNVPIALKHVVKLVEEAYKATFWSIINAEQGRKYQQTPSCCSANDIISTHDI
jgi:hypothetical protein